MLICTCPFPRPEPCLSLGPTGECEWSTWDIWRSSDVVERAIYLGLALMMAYTLFVLVRFVLRYYPARRELREFRPQSGPRTALQTRKRLISDLSQGFGTVRAIASAAPFLGLAGTAYGILMRLLFGDVAMEHSGFVAWISVRIAFALTTAAAGILVAIPAALSHLIRTRLELLRTERPEQNSIPDEFALRTRAIRFAQTLPLRRKFSNLPSFAIIAAPALSCVVAIFTAFEPYVTPSGLPVALPSTGCDNGPGRTLPNRIIVLRITNSGEAFINMEPEDWKNLRPLLGNIYCSREYRDLYLYAEDGVPFQTVADAVDIARNSPAPGPDSVGIKVVLITPDAARECVPIPVRTIPMKQTFG